MRKFVMICAALSLFAFPAYAQNAQSSMKAGDLPTKPLKALTAGKPLYLQTQWKVAGQDSTQGCSYGNWQCLENVCKAQMGQNASRGDAGCWQQGNQWFCHWACYLWAEVVP